MLHHCLLIMKLTQLPLPIARLTITCKCEKAEIMQHVILASVYAGPDAQLQLHTLSDGDAIDATSSIIVIKRSILFTLKCTRNRLAAMLCPDPLGELKRSARPPSRIRGLGPPGRERKGGNGKGKGNSAHASGE